MNRIHLPPSMSLGNARIIMQGVKAELNARAKRNPEQHAFYPGTTQATMREALCAAIKKINLFDNDNDNASKIFAKATIADLFEDGELNSEVFITAEEYDEADGDTTTDAAMLATVTETPPEARV